MFLPKMVLTQMTLKLLKASLKVMSYVVIRTLYTKSHSKNFETKFGECQPCFSELLLTENKLELSGKNLSEVFQLWKGACENALRYLFKSKTT
jgi:hypothetical protein